MSESGHSKFKFKIIFRVIELNNKIESKGNNEVRVVNNPKGTRLQLRLSTINFLTKIEGF